MPSKPVRHRRTAGPGRNRQHGATLVFTAFFLIVLVATLGLSIEVGRLYAAQSQLQKVANLAALDAARVVGGCTAEESGLQGAATTAATDAIGANDPSGAIGLGSGSPTLGSVVSNAGIREFTTDPGETGPRPNAVRVSVTRPAPSTLVGYFSAGSNLTADAAAANPVRAQIRVGGRLADVSPQLLPQLLGGTGVSVLDPSGLADASVQLGDLATELGVATPEQLLETPFALDAVLEGLGDATSGTASTILSNLAMTADDQSVVLGEALDIVGETGGDLAVNVGALTGALATLAAINRDEPIELDISQALPAGIADVNVLVRLLPPASGDGPQIAIGPPGEDSNGEPYTSVRSAQALIQINIGLLSIAGYNLSNLTLFVELARAEASLDSIRCARAGQPEHIVTLDTTSDTGRVGVGDVSDLSGGSPSAQPDAVTLVDAPLLEITAATNPPISVPGGGGSLEFIGPFPSESPLQPETKDIPGTDSSSAIFNALSDVGNNLDVDVDVAGLFSLPGGAVLGSIINPVNALLAPVLAPILDSVFQALGLSLGGGEVTVDLVDTEQPVLIES